MTATDELRRMLDERGIRHFDYAKSGWSQTQWEAPDGNRHFTYNTYDNEAKTAKLVIAWFPTPAQAIEATLGRGTCKPIISDNLTESEGTGDAWANCSECGHLLFVLTDPSSEKPNYCPNCGARVM